MNHIHKKRLYFFFLVSLGVSIGLALILYALKQNINLFLTPTDVTTKRLPLQYHFRLGGLVKNGSLMHDKQNLNIQFIITDLKHDIKTKYVGVLPDLFREGKGVIAEGNLDNEGVFIASEVLAKHDENYMPKSVYQALRKRSA